MRLSTQRCRACSVFAPALVVALLLSVPALAGEALRVEARVTRDIYYVGQAIEVRVGVVAGGERPKVKPPKVDGAEVAPIDTAFQQIETGGIGDVVTETNVFVSRFRVMPTRSGPLTIPPFYAKLDARSGSSAPIRLTIQPVPAEGRPASYLRGVGRLEARSEAVPASLRVGQNFEYRLVLNGPGARGATQWPLLPEFAHVPGLKVEPGETDLAADPPRRTFRFRARATAAGELVLPAVSVATFDPTLKRYVETRAPSVRVRVVDVPRFDPASLPDLPVDASADPRISWRALSWPVVAIVGTAALAVSARLLRRSGPRRWSRRMARELAKGDPADLADRVAAGLTTYLDRAIGRPGGELTPAEAGREVARATGDRPLADRAGRLIERCDRVRFAADAEASRPDLAAEASSFFDELARRKVVQRKG
jgi:hypothetical protein